MNDEQIKEIINEIKISNEDYTKVTLDSKYWDSGNQKVWQTHIALGTTGNEHYCHYKDDTDIEILMVLIESSNEEDVLYYIEESFDAMDSEFAFNKYDKENNIIIIYSDKKKCENKICELLANKTNKSKEYFMEYFSN